MYLNPLDNKQIVRGVHVSDYIGNMLNKPHTSCCQDSLCRGTINTGHRGPSCSLVWSLNVPNIIPDKEPMPMKLCNQKILTLAYGVSKACGLGYKTVAQFVLGSHEDWRFRGLGLRF